MENPDVIYTLTSRLDNSALQLLSTTSLWEEIKKSSTDQNWWYLRVQQLLGTTLERRLGADWKEVYRLLLPAATDKEVSPFTREVLANPLAVSVLLESGVDPSQNKNVALSLATFYGYIDTVKVLLSDPRVGSGEGRDPIRSAARKGRIELVKLLLDDGRFDPSLDDNFAIRDASDRGYTEIVKLLLADPRVDPSANENDVLRQSVFSDNVELVKLLLADPRVDPTAQNNYPIRRATDPEVVRLLLADPRVNPSVDNNEPIIKAINFNRYEVVKLLLNDRRVSLTSEQLKQYISEARTKGRPEMASLLAANKNTDLQDLDTKTLEYILEIDPYLPRDRVEMLLSNNFKQDHYYIFLRELIIKKLGLKYYFEWLVDQCTRHENALEYRRVIAAAAESYRETGTVKHTSPLFTAYSGFLLLAKTDNSQAIINLLSREGASQEGLQLAGMLIGAYLNRGT